MGTWIVQELRRGWTVADGKEPTWEALTEAAEQAAPFGPLIDPDHVGFYNPDDMEAAIVAFCRKTGQPPPSDRGGFLRCVYESLALKYRFVNEQVCEVSGTTTRSVNIVGGGCRNALLNQFTADALGVPVAAGPEEATAVGNFMVQALGLGAIARIEDAQPIIRAAFAIREFKPQRQADWDAAYERFRGLCA
jgi:rhamnulokinase